MRTFLAAALLITASFSAAVAQQPTVSGQDDIQNMGVAPKVPNGIGRADVRVFDEAGNPIPNASVKLESIRSDGYFCETDWGMTNERGVIVMPPLHMGEVKLKVKAPGFKSQNIQIDNNSLGEPLRITLVRK
jgi:Carboxypeptidase regulatory-like domain